MRSVKKKVPDWRVVQLARARAETFDVNQS